MELLELRHQVRRIVELKSTKGPGDGIAGRILDAQAELARRSVPVISAAAAADDRRAFMAALADLDESVGEELADIAIEQAGPLLDAAYRAGTSSIIETRAWRLNRVDRRALHWLKEDFTYWVGEHWGDELSTSIRDALEPAMRQGLSRTKAAVILAEALGDRFQRSAGYWENFGNHVATRSRNFGVTEGLVRAGATHYRIKAVLDDRTSPVCRAMHDRVFEVNQAVFLRDQLLAAPDPETVKEIAPWRKVGELEGVETEELPPGMELPPYHFGCRTTLVIWRE